MYNNLKINDNIVRETNPIFAVNFIGGPFLEIKNSIGHNFDIEFIDKETGKIHYHTNIGNNCWSKCNISYFIDWEINIKRDDGDEYKIELDLEGKRVYISIESSSIGDTLAWFPYIEEFRKKWNCDVVCSTFHNKLFIDKYTELSFIEPGNDPGSVYAFYKIGWFYNEDSSINTTLNPKNFRLDSLQKTASDILGLDFKHIKSKLSFDGNKTKTKRVGIGFHSTAQTKYWNNPTGWQEVVNHLISIGYEPFILSKEEDGYMNNFYPDNVNKLESGSIEDLMDFMSNCDFFIGIGSGLSWLSWTLDIPTILISGFSEPISEFSGDNVYRVFNDSVCNGCYNRYRFDPSDWNWCPDHKNTERQFECSKLISGEMVIDSISELIKKENI